MVRSGKSAPAVRDLQGALSIFLMLATKWFVAPIPIYLLWKFVWAPLNRSFADAENQERAKAHPQVVDDS